MVDVKETSRPPVMDFSHTEYDLFNTPWGWLGVAFTPRGLRRLVLPRADSAAVAGELGLSSGAVFTPLQELRNMFSAFFQGRGPCPNMPVDLAGLAGFTRRVLGATRTIPPGKTITYGELARRAGSPRACRAAGQVMARNPIPLVIPCHRVLAAAGPGGYAGGLELKARILALESKCLC